MIIFHLGFVPVFILDDNDRFQIQQQKPRKITDGKSKQKILQHLCFLSMKRCLFLCGREEGTLKCCLWSTRNWLKKNVVLYSQSIIASLTYKMWDIFSLLLLEHQLWCRQQCLQLWSSLPLDALMYWAPLGVTCCDTKAFHTWSHYNLSFYKLL